MTNGQPLCGRWSLMEEESRVESRYKNTVSSLRLGPSLIGHLASVNVKQHESKEATLRPLWACSVWPGGEAGKRAVSVRFRPASAVHSCDFAPHNEWNRRLSLVRCRFSRLPQPPGVPARTSSEYNAAVGSFFRLSLLPGLFDTWKQYCRDGQEQILFLQGRPGTNIMLCPPPPPPPPPWSTTSVSVSPPPPPPPHGQLHLSVCLLCELLKNGFHTENKTSLHLFCNMGWGGGGGGGVWWGQSLWWGQVASVQDTTRLKTEKWFLWTLWVIARPGLGCDFFPSY